MKKKILSSDKVESLEELPNVGPAMAADLRLIGIQNPGDLKKADPILLYQKLCQKTKVQHDPCVLDVFIAITRFMNGEPAKPWWAYTTERKKLKF